MNTTYLTLIERLVREGRPEHEIESILERVVEEDAEVVEDGLGDLPAAA